MLKVKLVVVGGATEGDEFQLKLPAILGRARHASIPLPHPLVSRNHCELLERDNCLFVRDLSSTNGTFVGSTRVDQESIVDHGDLLTIGTVTFCAFYDGMPANFDGHHSHAGIPVHQLAAGELDTSTITRIDTSEVGGPGKSPAEMPQKAK